MVNLSSRFVGTCIVDIVSVSVSVVVVAAVVVVVVVIVVIVIISVIVTDSLSSRHKHNNEYGNISEVPEDEVEEVHRLYDQSTNICTSIYHPQHHFSS